MKQKEVTLLMQTMKKKHVDLWYKDYICIDGDVKEGFNAYDVWWTYLRKN